MFLSAGRARPVGVGGDPRRTQRQLETRQPLAVLPDSLGEEDFFGDEHPRWCPPPGPRTFCPRGRLLCAARPPRERRENSRPLCGRSAQVSIPFCPTALATARGGADAPAALP